MKQKCICFDIDNTLIPWPSGQIPESTILTMEALRKQGHKLVIATGRLQKDAMRYAAKVGIQDVVADGGYSVTLAGTLQSMRSLDVVACQRFLRQLEANRIPWAVTTQNEPIRYTHYEDLQPKGAPWDHFQTVHVPHIDIEALTCVYKIYIYLRREEEAKYDIQYGPLECIRYGAESILIEPMDKAEGIRAVADHYGIPYEDVVTFGDGHNDLRMFEPYWLNIAMGNARESLKEKADYVTTDCDKDGIYHACRHFGWVPNLPATEDNFCGEKMKE